MLGRQDQVRTNDVLPAHPAFGESVDAEDGRGVGWAGDGYVEGDASTCRCSMLAGTIRSETWLGYDDSGCRLLAWLSSLRAVLGGALGSPRRT